MLWSNYQGKHSGCSIDTLAKLSPNTKQKIKHFEKVIDHASLSRSDFQKYKKATNFKRNKTDQIEFRKQHKKIHADIAAFFANGVPVHVFSS